MNPKTLTIQFNDEQLPILPVEPEAHLSFATHADGNELELTGNRAGLLLLAKAALGMAETIREDGFHIHLDDLYGINAEENWAGLRSMIEEDDSVPDREEVLMILDYVKDLNRCKELLKRLNCGYAYTYIQDRILPRLRNATVCTVRMKDVKGIALLGKIKEEESVFGGMTEERGTDPLQWFHYGQSSLSVRAYRRPLFALKTNLLFDAALMPNIEIELPIGKRWSLNGEYMFPWWQLNGDKYCLQVLSGGLEGRYWLGKRSHREVLTGHFLGLYAGGGKYDLQWKEKGYQGEFFIAAGLSYGYARRIARNLHLEFNLGIGLMRTDYRHYRTRDNYQTLLWQENGNYTWLGPTKVKVSLVWLLTRRKAADKK